MYKIIISQDNFRQEHFVAHPTDILSKNDGKYAEIYGNNETVPALTMHMIYNNDGSKVWVSLITCHDTP